MFIGKRMFQFQESKSFRSVKKFIGAFANPDRTLTEEEQALVPDISSDYVLPKEIVTVCQSATCSPTSLKR